MILLLSNLCVHVSSFHLCSPLRNENITLGPLCGTLQKEFEEKLNIKCWSSRVNALSYTIISNYFEQ